MITDSATLKPSLNHSYICAQILKQLQKYDRFEALPELTLDVGNGLTPDISVFPKELIKPNFFRDVSKFAQMPAIAIEIISSSQSIQTLLEKAIQLVEAGVKVVWTVEPFTQTIFVTTKSEGEVIWRSAIIESEGISIDFNLIFKT
jgi:Uma2 family endonuclease